MARLFNGTSDYISVARNAALEQPTNKCTVMAWVRRDGNQDTADTIVNKLYNNGGSRPYRSYWISWSGGNAIAAWIGWGTSAGQFYTNVGNAPADLTWAHVALVYDATLGSANLRLYVDGVSPGGANGTNNILYDTSANGPLVIGGLSGSQWTKGRIAEVCVWKDALSAAEIMALAKGVHPLRMRRLMICYYAPLYGAASPEPDYSGNVNNGTVTGATQADAPPVQPPFTFTPGDHIAAVVSANLARAYAYIQG